MVGALGLNYPDAGALEGRDRGFAALVARLTAQALERAELLVSERRAHGAQDAGGSG
jgi:GAF domain-containing protein